jgi:hypothetical protein
MLEQFEIVKHFVQFVLAIGSARSYYRLGESPKVFPPLADFHNILLINGWYHASHEKPCVLLLRLTSTEVAWM